MLTLYHSPRSRSSRIIQLLEELGARDKAAVEVVDISHNDGSGTRDPRNPHPEGKVPLLVHDGVEIWESNAIILYLTDLFPDAGLGPLPGHPLRGRYLSWLAWYGNVVGPVFVLGAAELSHPILDLTFRGVPELTARLSAALKAAPFLMGETFTAADLLLVSPYTWFRDCIPDDPTFRDWIERCEARLSLRRSAEFDADLVARAVAA